MRKDINNGPLDTCKAVLHLIRDISIRVDTDEYHQLYAAKELLASVIRRSKTDPRLENLEGTSIDILYLTVRAENRLQDEGITTIEQLVQFRPSDLLRIPHFGRKSLADVEKELKKIGKKLAE